jgi:hypothetical protein
MVGAGPPYPFDNVRHGIARDCLLPSGGEWQHPRLGCLDKIDFFYDVLCPNFSGAQATRTDPAADRFGIAMDAAGSLRDGKHGVVYDNYRSMLAVEWGRQAYVGSRLRAFGTPHQLTTAIGTDVVHTLGAAGTERALVTADIRLCIPGERLVARLAPVSHL